MGLFLKSDKEIEKIIENNTGKSQFLVKVSKNLEKPLGYSEKPKKGEYNKIIDYYKDLIKHLRLHNSGDLYYFGQKEYKNEIVNNYGKYHQKDGTEVFLVEGEIVYNRHLKIAEAFKYEFLVNFIHNLPPNGFNYLFINFIVKKFQLDSYEVGGVGKIESVIGKVLHKINWICDGNYIIFKNENNFTIKNITRI